MLKLIAIFATLVSLASCSFFQSPLGHEIIEGEQKIIDQAIIEALAPKNTVGIVKK